MGREPTNSAHLLRIIEAVGYVSMNNVHNFVGAGLKYWDKFAYLTNKVAKRLVKADLVRKIKIDSMYAERLTTIYESTDTKKTERVSNREWPHDSAVKDVAVAFYELLSERQGYEFRIEYNIKFALNEGHYQPDAWIQLSKDGKTYDFILEIEISRQPGELAREKMTKGTEAFNLGLIPLAWQGGKAVGEPLSKKTKFLYVLTPREYNRFTFARPGITLEQASPIKGEPRYIYITQDRKRKEFERVESLVNLKKVPSNFLFLPLHQFTELDQAVWHYRINQKPAVRKLI